MKIKYTQPWMDQKINPAFPQFKKALFEVMIDSTKLKNKATTEKR